MHPTNTLPTRTIETRELELETKLSDLRAQRPTMLSEFEAIECELSVSNATSCDSSARQIARRATLESQRSALMNRIVDNQVKHEVAEQELKELRDQRDRELGQALGTALREATLKVKRIMFDELVPALNEMRGVRDRVEHVVWDRERFGLPRRSTGISIAMFAATNPFCLASIGPDTLADWERDLALAYPDPR